MISTWLLAFLLMAPESLPPGAIPLTPEQRAFEARTPEQRALGTRLAKAVYAVEPLDLQVFYLQPLEKTALVMYGTALDKVEVLTCDPAVGYRIGGLSSEGGGFSAMRCKEGARIRTLAERGREGLARVVKEFPMDDAARRKLGLAYVEETLRDGSTLYAFPVVMFGHGVGIAYTVVVFETGSPDPLVVQGTAMYFCDKLSYEDNKTSRLCDEPAAVFKEIALAVREPKPR